MKNVYRFLRTKFWEDEKIISLPDGAKLFYLFLLSNPFSTQLGIYRLNNILMTTMLNFNQEKLQYNIRFLVEKGFIKYDADTNEIAILNWPKYNYSKNQGVLKTIGEELDEIQSYELVKSMQERTRLKEVKNMLLSRQKSLKLRGVKGGCREGARGWAEGEPSEEADGQSIMNFVPEKEKEKVNKEKESKKKGAHTPVISAVEKIKKRIAEDEAERRKEIRDDKVLFDLIYQKIRDNPAWWKNEKEYLRYEPKTNREVADTLKLWAAWVVRERPRDTTSESKIIASLRNWLMREKQFN